MNAPASPVPNYRALRIAVRHTVGVSASARLLFEDICDLAEKTGECVAMDTHFQQIYEAKPRTVRDWMKELREAGVLRSEGATNRRRLIPCDDQLRREGRLNLRREGGLSGANLGGSAATNLGGSAVPSIEYSFSERGEGEDAPADQPESFDAASAYAAAFPDFRPNIHQLVELASMTDRAAFEATLDVWRLNDYQPKHLVNFRDRYRKILDGEAGADGATKSPRLSAPVNLAAPMTGDDVERALASIPGLSRADVFVNGKDSRTGLPTYGVDAKTRARLAPMLA